MANSDDDDAYLYSSEEEAGPANKKQKVNGDKSATTNDKSVEPTEEEEQPDDDDSEEESSDDDIDIVIGDTPATSSGSAVQKLAPSTATTEGDGDAQSTTIISNNQVKESLDINKVAELDGKPLTQVDLEKLKDKPWRIPGSDISDYFNYGFDEISWTAYCCKQDKLRGEFNPKKLMEQIMGGLNGKKNPMGMPAMPPGMPSMPPGMPAMPPGMFMPMMPGMQNMPGMPTMPNFNSNNGVPPPPPPK